MKQYVLGETLYAGDRGEESAKRVTVVSLVSSLAAVLFVACSLF